MKEVESFELNHGTKVPTDNEAIDNVMEEAEEWEAPQISSSSSFYESIASRIYKDFNSGMRELYNNEARACRTARSMGARPRIEVKIDCEERNLIIHGVDSLGISEEVFKQIIKFIGKSGNMSGKEVGMFGMGFVSYQMLTDFMTLDTWTRETTEGSPSYTVFCREDLHTKKVVQKEPTLDTFGTKLEMILKSDVIITELIDTLTQCAMFSTVPTTIEIINSDDDELPDQVQELEQYKSVSNWFELNNIIRTYTHENAGVLEIQKFDSKSDKQLKSIFVRNNTLDFVHNIHYEDDDVEFKAVLGIVNEHEFDDNGKRTRKAYNTKIVTGSESRSWDEEDKANKTFLVGVPIDDCLSFGWQEEWARNYLNQMDWYINIKNERNYMPNANRDSLERKAQEKLSMVILNAIKDSFQQYNLEDSNAFKNSINKPLYSDNTAYNIDLNAVLDDTSNEILNTLREHFPVPDNNYGKTLKTLLSSGNRIIQLQSLRSDMMLMYVKHFKDNDIEFIRCKDHDKFSVLKDWGVILGDEYKAIHKLKMKREAGSKGTSSGEKVVLANKPCALTNNGRWGSNNYFGGKNYRSKGRTHSSTIGVVNQQNEVLPHRIIQFDNNKDDWLEIKARMDWNSGADILCVTRARKGLTVDTPEQFVHWFRTKRLQTTEGMLSIEEVEALDKDHTVYMSDGKPELNKEEKLEQIKELLESDTIGVFLDDEHYKRLGIYSIFRKGGIGYPKLRGKMFSIQTPQTLLQTAKDKKHRHNDYRERLSIGGNIEAGFVDRWLNEVRIEELFQNVYDRLILDTMLIAVRKGNIPDMDEHEVVNVVIKRLNLA